jgi:hypothetical protein
MEVTGERIPLALVESADEAGDETHGVIGGEGRLNGAIGDEGEAIASARDALERGGCGFAAPLADEDGLSD